MLTNILIQIVSAFITVYDWLMPNWGLPVEFYNGLRTIMSPLTLLNGFFPVFILLNCFIAIILYRGTILIMLLASSILNYVRGTGKGLDP